METFWTCLTEFITTTLSILASAVIAYLTFQRQEKKAKGNADRVCEINLQAALELFKAAIANLMFFLSDYNHDFCRQSLILYCQKIEAIERQLSNLADHDLPDWFIAPFKLNRYKLTDMRLSLYNIISFSSENPLPPDSFEELDVSGLIDSLYVFTQQSRQKPS